MKTVTAAILVGMMLCGCTGRTEKIAGYYGPTQPLSEVVAAVNENNAAIPTLYARIDRLEANIVDPKTNKTHFVNASGDIFVRKPKDLLLRAKKDPIGEVFELGSVEDRYWMTVFVEQDTMWWGWHRNSGKPCVRNMPIRPDLVGEVLGITELDTDLLHIPAVTMRFNNDLDVYMLVWNVKGTGHWYAEKEVWYDRKTLLPRKVLLFDQNGRIVLRADLANPMPIQVPNRPSERWPKMATYYDLFFPETKSRMTIQLGELALTTRNGNPKPGTIRFPEEPPVKSIIQIDQDCDQQNSK